MNGNPFFGAFGPPTGPVIDTTVYPTVAGLQAFLTSAGVLPDPLPVSATGLPWETWVSQAWREWEAATNRKPFLAEAQARDCEYQPEAAGTRVLDLRCGFVEITEVKANGRVLTPNIDYRVKPDLARFDDEPFEYIEFRSVYFAGSDWTNGFVVTGRRGYCEELPADVYGAILARGAMLAIEVLKNSDQRHSPQVSKVKQDDVEYEYSTSVTERGALAKSWADIWDAAVSRYKLITIV